MILEVFLYALMAVTTVQWGQDIGQYFHRFEKKIEVSITDVEEHVPNTIDLLVHP